MSEPRRLAAREVRVLVLQDQALLVCAYDSPVSFPKFPLPGALPLARLRELEASLPRDALLVFYCRCPDDKTATERAREYSARGFTRAAVLAGGHAAWPR